MFLSDKNVQDCLRYKHGLITAAQLADLLNYPDVDYVQHWANTSTFTTRHYEDFAATQKAERMANTVMSADTAGEPASHYEEEIARMSPKKHQSMRHGEFRY